MRNIKKSKHFKRTLDVETPTAEAKPSTVSVPAAKPEPKPRQGKRASRALGDLIRSVNLVPAPKEGADVLPERLVNRTLPSDSDLLAAISDLSRDFPELSAHLQEMFDLWQRVLYLEPEAEDDAETIGVRRVIQIDQTMRAHLVVSHYDQIRSAREVLYDLARRGEFRNVTIRGRSYFSVNDEHKVTVRLDPLGMSLQGVDVRDLRECAVCQKLFLARRVDSAVCDPNSKCAKTNAKRNERKNRKARAELAARKAAKKGGRKKR